MTCRRPNKGKCRCRSRRSVAVESDFTSQRARACRRENRCWRFDASNCSFNCRGNQRRGVVSYYGNLIAAQEYTPKKPRSVFDNVCFHD